MKSLIIGAIALAIGISIGMLARGTSQKSKEKELFHARIKVVDSDTGETLKTSISTKIAGEISAGGNDTQTMSPPTGLFEWREEGYWIGSWVSANQKSSNLIFSAEGYEPSELDLGELEAIKDFSVRPSAPDSFDLTLRLKKSQ